MNADLSAVPEIAQLAAARPARPGLAAARTVGRLAADLAALAAAPERWWDLVRFDPAGPVRVPLPGPAGRWLLVLPPGADTACGCHQATALAGEAAECSAGVVAEWSAGVAAEWSAAAEPGPRRRPGRPLRPGHVLVHGPGRPHRVHADGPGYSVTLHARG